MENKTDLVSIERLHQDKFWIISIHEFSTNAIDAWADSIREYRKAMGDSKERYLVYDTSNIPRLGMTSYLRKIATKVGKEAPQETGRVAVVLSSSSIIWQVIQMFLNFITKQLQPKLELKIFSAREEAIAWVEEIRLANEKVV
jgi:hypothetical protein